LGEFILSQFACKNGKAVLIDEHKQAGSHSVSWDAATVASGTYFYRIQAGENVETRKMVLLK